MLSLDNNKALDQEYIIASMILLMEVIFFPLTTAYSSSTMKNSRSKFSKITEVHNILELTLAFALAESNPLTLQLERVSPSRRWDQVGQAVSSTAEPAKLCEVG